MKVLIINSSPRKDGNSSLLINEIEKVFKREWYWIWSIINR